MPYRDSIGGPEPDAAFKQLPITESELHMHAPTTGTATSAASGAAAASSATAPGAEQKAQEVPPASRGVRITHRGASGPAAASQGLAGWHESVGRRLRGRAVM